MKLNFFQYAFLVFAIISCQDQNKEQEKQAETPEIEVLKSSRCYSYSKGKDTIYMKITNLEDSMVAGSLSYNLFEKDRNDGDFEGNWKGDSLFADYKFQSEGTISTREIFFYKTDSGMIEGFGSMENSLDKAVFQDHNSLELNTKIILKPVDCY